MTKGNEYQNETKSHRFKVYVIVGILVNLPLVSCNCPFSHPFFSHVISLILSRSNRLNPCLWLFLCILVSWIDKDIGIYIYKSLSKSILLKPILLIIDNLSLSNFPLFWHLSSKPKLSKCFTNFHNTCYS